MIIVPKHIDVVISSYGGVGTTFLMQWIRKYKSTNSLGDGDYLKHSPLPPISYRSDVRFLYVYGDPILATVSLFRRNFHSIQSKKLLRYNRSKRTELEPEMSLKQYSQKGMDMFCFEQHFRNWFTDYQMIPTLYVKYDSLNKKEVQFAMIRFLGLPEESITEFPELRTRKSNMDGLDEQTTDGLLAMYGDFSNYLSGLNDIEEKGKLNQLTRIGRLIKGGYLLIWLKEDIYKKLKTFLKKTPYKFQSR